MIQSKLGLSFSELEARVSKLERAIRAIYRETLPAGTVRASDIERILERHGLEALSAESNGTEPQEKV